MELVELSSESLGERFEGICDEVSVDDQDVV
jgi:hypothetical protein